MSEKTVYPGAPVNGASNHQAQFNEHGDGTNFPGAVPSPKSHKKPVLGFMYSVSKDPTGEFWPLYLGANTIGRGQNCTVCLKEASVSEQHATLVIRQMQNQGADAGLFVFIQDVRSMCGTLVNGVSLDFNPKECKSGDIITVGENYELYFILVEPKALGLFPKENFKSPQTDPVPAPAPNPNPFFKGNKGTLSGEESLEEKMSTMYKPH